MNRLQEQQFITEHACSWKLVIGSWLALTAIVAGALLFTCSPIKACDVNVNNAAQQIDWQWPAAAQRLQHRDDDPDEFFDPSAP